MKTGEELIQDLCKRLDFQDKRLYDSNILQLLRSLNGYELNQLIAFGTVDKWEREKIERLKNATDKP